MDVKLLNLQTKGQIMLPKKWRDEFGTNVFKAIKKGSVIVLYPVQVSVDEKTEKLIDRVIDESEALLRSLADQ